jgi:hypothetical protein
MAYIGTKPANQIIDSTLIADGVITTADLANSAVTDAKIASMDGAKLTGSKVIPKGVLPTGSILQVVSSATSGLASGSTTSTSYVDISGGSLTITPNSASNRILVLWSDYGLNALVSGANVIYNQRLLRSSTQLLIASVASESASGGLQAKGAFSFVYLDSPNTTSAVTYKVQHSVNNSSSTGTSINGCLTLLEVAV